MGTRPGAVSWLCAVAVLAAGPRPACAQVGGPTATLRGHVADSTGGVTPGASVTLSDVGTKALRSAVTDEQGGFAFIGLFPGTFELTIELTGFKTFHQTAIVLGPNDARGIDVRLEVGDRTETVVVTTSADIVQTETGAREGRLSAKQIDNLSIIGRSSLELLRILPGVVAPDQNQLESVSFIGGANNTQAYTVNGIRSTNNTVSLDGSTIIDFGSNSGLMINVNNDMVQEVKVESSNFNAEYGSGGMNISAVTKSGSSDPHGSLYWYGRDHHLAANDRSNSIVGIDKPRSGFFYPGGNVGGPVPLPFTSYNDARDKLFFWFGAEVQRQNVDSGSTLTTTMSERARTGDLSEFLAGDRQNLNHPAVVLIPGGFRDAGSPAPNNDLRPYVDPLGLTLAGLYPLPNYSDADNRYNYAYSALEPTNRLEMKLRVDWNLNPNTRVYARLAHDNEDVESPRGIWWGGQVKLPTPGELTNRGRSYSVNVVEVLSTSMTNEALATFSRLTLDSSYRDPAALRKDALGTDFVGFFPGQSPYVPLLLTNSWSGGQLGDFGAANPDVYAHNDELLFSDKLTKLHGAHAVKIGASLARLQKQQNSYNNEDGSLVFSPFTPGGTGSQIGDLIVGRPFQVTQGTMAQDARFRMWNLDLFAQDSWKIRRNLTLDVGIRAGYWTNNAELNGLGTWFDPTTYDPAVGAFVDPAQTRLNGVRYAALGQAPLGLLPNRSPFAVPRVNLAWDISGDGTSVVRGGYGMFVNRPQGNVDYANALSVPPNSYNVTADAFSQFGLAGQGLTYQTVRLIPFGDVIGTQAITTITSGSFTFPKTHSYSVSYARRIFWNQVIEAAYVGTTGRDLVGLVNINLVPLGALSSGVLGNADLSVPVNRAALDPALVNTLRPYPAFGPITPFDYNSTSQYHSLQVTLSRQTSRHLQYFVAYTLSRAEGTLAPENVPRDPFDPAHTYGILETDRTHVLNVSWNAMLPDGAHGAFDSRVGRGLLNGWQLSGISSVLSGTPIHLPFSGDAAGPGVSQAYFGTPDVFGFGQGNALVPVYTCDPRLNGRGVGEKLLNIACVSVPAFGTNGPVVPPYDIRAPWHSTHDLTLFKNFAIGGSQKLQFRAGFFDLFNTAYVNTSFGSPDMDFALETVCNRRVDHVPDGAGGYVDGVCDPSGGYSYTQNTLDNFGKILLKRGHRVIELVVKYYF
jgi:Carboxypeptidase regulatory-like domain/TonB-dependent Receptor Plug Domain